MTTCIETVLENWEQMLRLNKFFLSSFVFRGQKDSTWDLKTSIERMHNDYSKFNFMDAYDNEEKWMIYEFTRKARLYTNISFPIRDKFEWLAVMQHYGAPTRLLDFTESIYIAAYFAVIESHTDSAIWAINHLKLRDNLKEKYGLKYKKGATLKDEINLHHIKFANQFIAVPSKSKKDQITTSIPLEPKLCTERLARQQGLFIMPSNPELSFMRNLESAFNNTNSEFRSVSFKNLLKTTKTKVTNSNIGLIKIIIPHKLFSDIADYLKEMNITAEILFPGLDGLAKSLIHTQIIT
jgi:hypothetical protein